MYSALLVDDEPTVLDVLKSTVPWSKFNVSKLLTAADGEQALLELEQNKVDLLITDIRMPNMDGLQLIEKVRSLYPHTRCILLSAYSEFEYAKTALLLGVENYILKPFQQDELERTIEKALDNLYQKKENSVQLFRNNILMRWANGTINENELNERALYLNINTYCGEYCVVCLNKLTNCSLEAFAEYLRKKTTNTLEIQHFWNDDGYCVLIIGGHSLSSDFIKNMFKDATQEMKLNGAFLAASGPIVEGSENVSQSYQVACETIKTTKEANQDLFITYETSQNHIKDTYCQNLTALYQIADVDERQNSYHCFAEQLLCSTNQDTYSALTLLTHSLYQLFEQKYPNKPEIRSQLYNRIHISSYVTTDNFTDTAVQLLETGYLLYQYYDEQLNPVIQLAISYIHTHYAESLSLKEFCIKNKMNTAYLGFLFKKETGIFFNNYLAQYRISSSLRLLDETDMQINDIASAVGFSSPSYYISCFKKQIGVSPIKYRSLHV